MKQKVSKFKNRIDLIYTIAEELQEGVHRKFKEGQHFFLALSGGTTPNDLFRVLSSEPLRNEIVWSNVHIFWGDERCVHPDDSESNYGNAKRLLLDYISIPKGNIHRIKGEEEPATEAERYSKEILRTFQISSDQKPRFDWIFLGLGTDGHTASLFPGSKIVTNERQICKVTKHPDSSQYRITLTLRVINKAMRVTFLVTGENKKNILGKILKKKSGYQNLPAALVQVPNGLLDWYMDEDAAPYGICEDHAS